MFVADVDDVEGTMWKKNLLFGATSLLGMAMLAGLLLPKSRLPGPESHDDDWLQNEHAEQVLSKLNAEFRADWEERGYVVAELPKASDLTVARRISLALTGTIPSLEEIRAFESQPEETRLAWWVSHLLEDKRYSDYVAERLARAYVGVDDGPFLVYRRRRFVSWLSDRLEENMAYDELVTRLISDKGLWTDSPPVNFVSVTANPDDENQPDPIRLAARTSRAFLGMRIDCLQCHDDNLGTINLGPDEEPRDGTQQDFHQLAAFFSDVSATGRGIHDAQEMQPYKYTYLDHENESIVDEVVPFRSDLLPAEGSRRDRLATWLTHPENKQFARAIVNRTWAIMFGRPLVDPIDDIPLHGEMPPGLDVLADDFVKSGFDIQRLIRLIALSEPFVRDSVASFEITDEHEEAFAVFRPTRLRPEQVAGSIIQASTLSTIDASANVLTRLARFGEENEFVNRYGDRGEDEFAEQSGTIPQQLLLMNGKLVAERDQANPFLLNAISQLALLTPDAKSTVRTTYLTVLTREPNARELEYFARRFKDRTNDERVKELEDLYWVLFKSPDFVWNR